MPIQPQRDIALAERTTFRVGGRARYFVEAESDLEIIEAIQFAEDAQLDTYVLGGGSNLVISDSGVSGLVLKIATSGITISEQGDRATVCANAGVVWDELVRFTTDRDLQGLECLSGIPGSVGATPIQNVGAYGQEVAQTLTLVRLYDRVAKRTVTFQRAECELGYRDSRFKNREPNRYVVLSVEFELQRKTNVQVQHREVQANLETATSHNPTVSQVRAAVLELRAKKSMLANSAPDAMRSAGSFFVNPIVATDIAQALVAREGPTMPVFPLADGRAKLSAGWLIEKTGFSRGHSEGPVGLSPHHCLVLVAHERARAEQVVALGHRIRDRVERRFGIQLIPEPNFWGFDQFDAGLPILDDLAPPTLGSISRLPKAP